MLQIEPAGMRALILHMIQLDPTSRLSAKDYLTSWGSTLFPEFFTSFLQPFCHTLLPLSADLRLAAVQQAWPQILHFMAPKAASTPQGQSEGGTPASLLPSFSAEPSEQELVGRTAGGIVSQAVSSSGSKPASAAVTRPSSANRSLTAGKLPAFCFHALSQATAIQSASTIHSKCLLKLLTPKDLLKPELFWCLPCSHYL